MSNGRTQSIANSLKSISATIKPWVQLTRVSKFAGTMVLFWPYAWSLTIGARTLRLGLSTYTSLMIFGFIAASLLHSGGCIWNDILDREFDRQVERTKNRPLAAGTISVPGALVFLFIHIAILMRMIWNLNDIAFKFGVLFVIFFPGLYPFMKRVTYWPQAWLGIAMNVGVPMAWLALEHSTTLITIAILYAGCWAWTMWYDTIYACQDKRDDVKAGVKSTALLFGTWIKPILTLFATALMISLYIAGVSNNMGMYYFLISIGGGTLYLATDMYNVNLDSPKACWDSFHRNGFTFGGLIWTGALVDYLTSL